MDLELTGLVGSTSPTERLYTPPEPPEDLESPIPFSEAVSKLNEENHIANNLTRKRIYDGLGSFTDEEFQDSLNFHKVEEDFKQYGIELNQEVLKDLYESKNPNEYYYRLQRTSEKQDTEREVAKLGGLKALGATFASYGTDPIGFAIDAATGNGIRKGASIMTKALSLGGRAIFAESFQEMIRGSDEAVNTKEYMTGVASAFLISGTIGAFSKGEIDAIDTLKKSADPIETFDTTIDISPGDAGAARNTSLEEIGDGVVVPEDSMIDYVEGLQYASEPVEQAFTKLSPSAAASGARIKYPQVQFVHQKILGTSVNKNKNKAREFSALDDVEMHVAKYDAPWQRTYNEVFDEIAREKYGKNVITKQFAGDVQQEVSGDIGTYVLRGSVDDVSPAIKKGGNAIVKHFKDIGDELEKAGIVTPNGLIKDGYIPRKVSYYNSARAVKGITGEGNSNQFLSDLIYDSIEAGRKKLDLEIDEKVTRAVAKAYATRALKPPSPQDGFRKVDNITGLDLTDRKAMEELIQDSDLSTEAKAYVFNQLDGLKKPEKISKTPHLEHRLPLDMTVTKKRADGKLVTMSDLFENDVQKLSYDYSRWAAAELALKKKGLSLDKLDQMRRELAERVSSNKAQNYSLKGAPKPKDLDAFDFAHRAVQGLSYEVDPDKIGNRALRAIGKYNFITKMGASGFNAITEASTLLASGQLKNFFKAMPQLAQITKSVIKGKPPEGFVNEAYMLLNGLGDTWSRHLNSSKHLADSATRHNDGLSKVENFLEGASNIVTANSGLSHITDITRRMSAVQGLNLLDTMAQGGKLPKWWKGRSLDWTLSPKRQRAISEWMGNPENVTRGKAGELLNLNRDSMPSEVLRYMEEFMYSFTSNNILNVTKGSVPKVFQTPLGGIVFQFKSFVFGAWEKHVLNDLSHADSLAAQKLLYGASLGAAVYIARQHIEHPLDEAQRKENLTPENILKNGSSYAVNAVMVPEIIDTITAKGFGQGVLNRKRTSGLGSNLLVPPALSTGADLNNVTNLPFDLLRGSEISKEQVSGIFALSMMDGLWQTRFIKNWLKEDLKSERTKDKKEIEFDFEL